MRPALLLLSPLLGGALVAVVLHLREPAAASPPPETPASATGGESESPRPAPKVFSAEDVFRRAFWRHPSPDDQVLHAERVEAADAAGQVDFWRWFIAVHPGPALLEALRSPGTFGLRSTPSPAALPADGSPEWFPRPGELAGFEVFQSPAGGLTVLYRARDNLLYATDRGSGFARPARSP